MPIIKNGKKHIKVTKGQYEKDEEDLAKEIEWIRVAKKISYSNKRKLNTYKGKVSKYKRNYTDNFIWYKRFQSAH